MVRIIGVVVAGAILLASSLVTSQVAAADPQQFNAIVGVGSHTLQDVFGAFAGFDNGIQYKPLLGSPSAGSTQVASWDPLGSATNGGGPCISPKAPGSSINRPRGGLAGLRALSRAIDGTGWGDTTCGPNNSGKPVSGLIDFARSVVGPSVGDTGTALTYIPFARDALTFGWYANGVSAPVSTLTRANLQSLFSTGPAIINGVNVVPCGLPAESDSYLLWQAITGASPSSEAAATATCNNATTTPEPDGRVEPNNGAQLKAKGDALVGSEVIVAFSAGQFIAQNNGTAVSTLVPGVDLGAVSDDGNGSNLGKPYKGALGGPTDPALIFYSNPTFGMDVYVVLDTLAATGPGNQGIKTLFVGASSAICSGFAQNVVNLFGFLSASSCGATTLQGSLVVGTV